jgi:catechol 2,3-dioxygenase-like lactoylglutathione lyase family enzyme
MKPRIKVLTLGVSDLEKSLTFYRDGLGWPTRGVVGTEFEDGAVVFFDMNDDLISLFVRRLHWPRMRTRRNSLLATSCNPSRKPMR